MAIGQVILGLDTITHAITTSFSVVEKTVDSNPTVATGRKSQEVKEKE